MYRSDTNEWSKGDSKLFTPQKTVSQRLNILNRSCVLKCNLGVLIIEDTQGI